MLVQQQSEQFSEHSSLYDLIVPKHNLLRQINNLEKQLAYCKELEKHLENEPSIISIPAVKE